MILTILGLRGVVSPLDSALLLLPFVFSASSPSLSPLEGGSELALELFFYFVAILRG